MKKLLLLLVLSMNMAIGQEPPQDDGGTHGGGGDADEQMPLKVTEKYYSSVTDALHGSGLNILEVLLKSGLDLTEQSIIKNTLTKVKEREMSECISLTALQLRNDKDKLTDCLGKYLSFLELSSLSNLKGRIVLVKDRACLNSLGYAKDASVMSPGSINSKICLSLNNLRRFSKEKIEGNLVALIIHEYLHLLGFSDSRVDEVHQIIVSRYHLIKTNLSSLKKEPQRIFHVKRSAVSSYLSLKGKIEDQNYSDLMKDFQHFRSSLSQLYFFSEDMETQKNLEDFENELQKKEMKIRSIFDLIESRFLSYISL
jgi:hypothetical protein